MEYVLVRNNKAPVKLVFEYLEATELRNPNSLQKLMLQELCDGVEFYNTDRMTEVKEKMNPGDYLYSVKTNDTLFLECIHNGKNKTTKNEKQPPTCTKSVNRRSQKTDHVNLSTNKNKIKCSE